MSVNVSKSGISSSITVIITIILALVVLGVGLGMVSKAKPVHSVDDLIEQTWDLFNENEENNNVDIDTLCSSGEYSDEMTFVVRKGILDQELSRNTIITDWRCDVPGGIGTCLITKLERYEKVEDALKGGYNRPNRGFFEFKINKTPNDYEYYSDNDGHCIGVDEDSGWFNYYYSKDIGISYHDGDEITLDGFFQSIHTCMLIDCDEVAKCRTGKIIGSAMTPYERGGYKHGNYEFNFTYYYCCPENYEWNTNLKACCPLDDCQTPIENNFTEYCANSEKISGKSLIEKEDCGVSVGGCTSNNNIQDNCDEPQGYDNPYNMDNNKVMCLDRLGSNYCTRDGVQTGQCLRLNFKNYYGNSVYVKDLWFRSGSDGGHDKLYVFGCYDGSCGNNGDGWHVIEENVEGYNVMNHIFVDKKVDMIDICPEHKSRDHKIAWVKFTTNESLEAEETYCCYDNTGTFCISKAECDDKGGEIGDSCTSPLDCGGNGCTPDWSCSDWSNCIDGMKTRTCTDLNDCGTEDGKPSERDSCHECASSSECDTDEYCNYQFKCKPKIDDCQPCGNPTVAEYLNPGITCKSGLCAHSNIIEADLCAPLEGGIGTCESGIEVDFCANDMYGTLLTKEFCNIEPSEDDCTNSNPWCCVKDNDIQTSCDSDPTDWGSDSGDTYKGNNKPLCLDHSDEGNCKITTGYKTYDDDDVLGNTHNDVGQCAVLDFKNRYGRAVKVNQLSFRYNVENNGCHDDLDMYVCYDNEYDCDATYDPAWTLAVNNINQDGDTATKTYTENDFENWFPSDVFSSGSSKIRKIAICFDDDNGCDHDYRIAWIKGKITL